MAPEFFIRHALDGALALLPASMDSLEARAMVVAICLQESKLQYRKQVAGPARGYAQFESGGGVLGVLNHPLSSAYSKTICAALDVSPSQTAVYAAIEQNDILAAAFARLLLWTLPKPLPSNDSPEEGWRQYIEAWRPGQPHRETWDGYFRQAWTLVEEAQAAKNLTSVVDPIAKAIQEAATTFVQSYNALDALVTKTTTTTTT